MSNQEIVDLLRKIDMHLYYGDKDGAHLIMRRSIDKLLKEIKKY